MLFVYIGLYTLLLAIVWGFFIVTKIHAYKFKNFSNQIPLVTSFMIIFLFVLSIGGYVTIFLSDTSRNTTTIRVEPKTDFSNFENINY